MTKPEDATPHVWTEPVVIELREERAVVETLREAAGFVTVRRERQTRTETVAVELVTEKLFITAEARGASYPLVALGDQELEPGRTYEVTLYREEAEVSKRPVVYEQVRIDKRSVVERQQIPVTLAREELDVEPSAGVWQRPPEEL